MRGHCTYTFRILVVALQRLQVDLLGAERALAFVRAVRASCCIAGLLGLLARLKVREGSERRNLLGRIAAHVEGQDVEVVTALGHERKARRRLVLPVATHVRVRKVLPAHRLNVLDIDDLAQNARVEHLLHRSVVRRVSHHCVADKAKSVPECRSHAGA